MLGRRRTRQEGTHLDKTCHAASRDYCAEILAFCWQVSSSSSSSQWRGGRVGDFGEVFWRGGGGLFLIVCSIGTQGELRAEGDNSLEVSGWWSARDRSVGPVVINYESRTSPLISAIIGERVYWEWDSSWLKARCVEWEQGVGSTSLRKRSRVRAGCG